MIRFLLLSLLFFLAYTFFKAVGRLLMPPRNPPTASQGPAGEEMVRDPVCGTYFPKEGALSKTVGGEKHYFCSKTCRDAYPGGK